MSSISDAIAKINADYGDGAVMTLGDNADMGVEAVSTGSLFLDRALGVGGLPKGRVTEIYGPEASGKTTLALHVVAEAQRAGSECVYIDAEHSLDPAYAAAIGCDIDRLIISQPDNGEQALDIVERLTKTGEVGVIVVDSVAALVPRAEIDGDMGDSHVGLQARLMSQAMRKIVSHLNRTDTICIFINQLREKIGVMFGSPEVTTGGRALKFYASVRLDIRRIQTVREGDEATANRVRVKVVKNKVAPPHRQAEFDIIYGVGINYHGELLADAIEAGVIAKKGGWFSMNGETVAQGQAKVEALLRDDPEFLAAVQAGLESA